MKIVPYTAITGGKDAPREDITCFTGPGKFVKPVMEAKIYKVLSHQYVFADYSIWMDGNIHLLIEPKRLVEEWLGDEYGLAVWKHFGRDCIYDEQRELDVWYPELHDETFAQVEKYRNEGYPEHNGLAECNVIVRKHNDKVKRFNEMWWSEICRHSQRDQLSFPYVASKTDININYIHGDPRNHAYFIYENHRKQK